MLQRGPRTRRVAAIGVAIALMAAASAAGGQTYVSVSAGGSVLRVKPASIHLVSNENLIRMRWHRWGGPIALATASDSSNFPSAGHLKVNPVSVSLRHRKLCGTNFVYTYVGIHFTAGVPYAGMPHTINYAYGCPT